jgi:hypothetical protein
MDPVQHLVPFTGDYATSDGHTARFRVIGGHLSIQLADAGFFPLRQVSDARFGVSFCVDFMVHFDTHDGHVPGGTLVMGRARMPLRRRRGLGSSRQGSAARS